MPRPARTSRASGAMPSPQPLSRGKSARSTTSTRADGSARRAAAAQAAPAGPPPTTTTSQCSTDQTLGAGARGALLLLGGQCPPGVEVVLGRLGGGDEVQQHVAEPVRLVEVRPVPGAVEHLDPGAG